MSFLLRAAEGGAVCRLSVCLSVCVYPSVRLSVCLSMSVGGLRVAGWRSDWRVTGWLALGNEWVMREDIRSLAKSWRLFINAGLPQRVDEPRCCFVNLLAFEVQKGK